MKPDCPQSVVATRAALLRRREARIVAFRQHHVYEIRPARPEPATLHEAIRTNQGWDSTRLGEPTDTRPGSWERIEIYRLRLEQGLAIWNPKDRPADVFGEKLAELFPDDEDQDDWEEFPCDVS